MYRLRTSSCLILPALSCLYLTAVFFTTDAVGQSSQTWLNSSSNLLASTSDGYCDSETPIKSGLAFRYPTAPPATLAITCVDQLIELHCCVAGYTSLIWEQYYTGQWTEVVAVTSQDRQLLENNQTLVLRHTARGRDAGPFRCVANNKTAQIQNTVELDIRDCPEWNNAPELLEPNKDESHKPVKNGQNLTVDCSAFFGRLNMCQEECYAGWLIFPDIIPVLPDATERIYSEIVKSLDGNAMTSRLHINDVNDSDFTSVFQCYAVNKFGNVSQNVTLVHFSMAGILDRPDLKIALAVVGSFVASAVLILTVLWKFRLDVRLWFKEHSSHLQDKGDADYDVVLLTPADAKLEDVCMYEYLHDTLEGYGYTVFSQRDINYGGHLSNNYDSASKTSRCVVVVLTSSLDGDMISICLSDLSVSKRRLVFIKYKLNSDLLNDELLTGVKERLRISNCVTWSDDVVVNEVDNKLKVMCRNKRDRRAVDEFWKRLRLALPPLPKDRRGTAVLRQQGCDRLPKRTEVTPPPRDSTSSQQPLMNSIEDEDEGEKRVHHHTPDEQRVELADVEAALVNSC